MGNVDLLEKPRPLPQGWEQATVGDTANIVRGVSFPKNARKTEPQDGHVACLRTANVQRKVEWDDLWFVPEEYVKLESRYVQFLDVLISVSNSRELVGKVAQVTALPYKSTLGAFISLLRFSSNLDAKCCYYQMTSHKVQAEIRYSASTTTNISNISSSKLSAVTLKVPPFPEQHRIVAEIEKQFTRLDASVDALKRVQGNLNRYRASVLKAACEGKLVPTEAEIARSESRDYEPADRLLERILIERRAKWEAPERRRGKYKEQVAADTADLPGLPDGWVWATVEQLASHEPNSITDGPFGSNLKTSHYTEQGPRVIRLQNIGDGHFTDAYAHISWDHYRKLSKHEVTAGDLVIAALGKELPRSCLIPSSVGPAIVKADCIRFRPAEDLALATYLNVALNSEHTRKRTANIVHGVGRPRLNLGEVKRVALPLPPFSEQRRIVAEVERRLSVIEQAEAAVETGLKRAERLRQSILKQAFSGKLVPQDPNDEPASVLLERIRAEREAAEATAKSSRKPRRRKSKSARKSKLNMLEQTQ